MRGARISLALLACGAFAWAGSAGATTLVGTNAPNLLVGTKSGDRLAGKAGADVLEGKAGGDLLNGGRGRDTLIGGPGKDRIVGGPGNDVIRATDGLVDRRVDGGGGLNTCVVDMPIDLPVTANCGTIQAGPPPGSSGRAPATGGGGGSGLNVTTAQGLLCLPPLGCVFTITGNGADALVGTVTAGGAVTSLANVAVNAVVTGTWLATGIYNCSARGAGYLVVTIGSKSTPRIPVNC